MKLAVNILLIVFVTFLSTPTIVSVIKKSTDTSYFYSMSEEELTHKEVKAEFKFETLSLVFFVPQLSRVISSENLLKHNNIASSIFIPPPEQV